MRRNYLWFFELIIIIVSFFLFSNRFSPDVNSDSALSVLMTHDYSFPEAIYCWGQDRGGTIVPLIGQLFYKLLGFGAVWAESLARYLILILGFLSFRRFLKSHTSKIALAIIYFLPPHFFIGFTIYSWGLMYSFIGITCFLIQKSLESELHQKYYWGLGAIVTSIISIWTMDQGFVPLSILIAYLIYRLNLNRLESSNSIPKADLLFILVGVIITVLIIAFLKSKAVVIEYYYYSRVNFNTIAEVYDSIIHLKKDILQGLSLHQNPFNTFYCFSLALSIPIGLNIIYKNPKKKYLFILLNCISLLFLLITSNWVLYNKMSGRYFSGIYFTWSFLFLICFEKANFRNKLSHILLVIPLSASINTIISNKDLGYYKFESKYKKLAKFEQLGNIGIIGNYWYSYGISFRNPDLIVATPHEGNEVKNPNLINKVFNQEKIYLVKNDWLEEFPEDIEQFGRKLKKIGTELKLADIILCEYAIID